MNTQNPRRPASSRTTTPRPRKIAGRGPEPTENDPVEGEPTRSALPSRGPTVAPRRERPTEAASAAPSGRLLDVFRGKRVTTTLLVVLGVLCAVVVALGVWFFIDNKPGAASPSEPGTVVIPSGQPPVQMNQSDIDQGVDQAAKDVVTLMSLHYRTYDQDVAKALDLTTTNFAPQYRQLTADAKSGYLAQRIDLSAKVIGQGVVRADTTRLQALLFVNQWTTKGIGKDRRLVLTSFRVLMTMVHTNTGWLVDGMDTQ